MSRKTALEFMKNDKKGVEVDPLFMETQKQVNELRQASKATTAEMQFNMLKAMNDSMCFYIFYILSFIRALCAICCALALKISIVGSLSHNIPEC